MDQIVECVPNFSEGRSKEVINAISDSIRSVSGVSLIDVDAGQSTNRTVYTLVGSPCSVVEAALVAASRALELIDMTKQKGEHPRLGAMDVCPFIPVRNVTMTDCVALAHRFARQLAEKLNVPVYLYGEASTRDYRKTIPQIRQGEYESLKEKLLKEGWEPDYGPKTFVPTWGATIVGARKFLIAYNINILSTKEQAHRIALDIREQGRGDGKAGKLKAVQAIGWTLDEEKICQISVNISDFEQTPIHAVYEECRSVAEKLNLPITGSQIVGVLPLEAILQASRFYMDKENLFVLDKEQQIRLAIDRLGLNSLGQFKPAEKIIEYMLGDAQKDKLLSLTVQQLIETVAGRSPAPGGGSVSALVAALGASLSMMVCWLTYGTRKFEKLDATMRTHLAFIHPFVSRLSKFVDADSAAFDGYMEAMKLPNKSEEDIKQRSEKMEVCLEKAANVPLDLQREANKLWPTLRDIAPVVNEACISDLQVGVKTIETGVWGAHKNVLINVKQLKNKQIAEQIKEQSEHELKLAEENLRNVLKIIEERIQNEEK